MVSTKEVEGRAWRNSETERRLLAAMDEGVDTLPKFLLRNYKTFGHKHVAMRHKDLGIWNRYTWVDCYQHIKNFGLGLASLGLKKGDKVCIIGDNEPEWFWAELAVQAMGGIAIGLYVDITPPELKFFVENSEATFAVANDQEQTDKFLEIKDEIPNLKRVIYWDPKGMWSYKDNPFVIDFKDVQALGEKYEKEHPGFFEESIEKGTADDIAIFAYTSGTTGALPKAAMISHNYLTKTCLTVYPTVPMNEADEYLSYVPPAWIAEQMMGIGSWVTNGIIVNFIEEPETALENIREISPSTLLLGSRQWEDLLSSVQVKINDAGFIKKLVYNLCLPIGYKVADYRSKEQRRSPLFWRILFQLANWFCFRPIKDTLGVQHTRTAISGGSLIGPETFRFFLALGIKLKSVYGITEAMNLSGHMKDIRPDSVGPPMPGATIRITDEGEVLAIGQQFSGYYNNAEATAKTMENDYFKSGDAGFIDDNGHLILLDRLKDMLQLKGGEKYSATYIENHLKFSSYIKEAMVVGGKERDYLFVIICIDFDSVGKWAERNRIPYTTYVDLSQKPEVYDLILKEINRVNRVLPPNARIVQYANLYKEFDPDEGELTRTRKLRRTFLEERYRELIEAAYNGQSQVTANTEVKYRDGRVGKITTPVHISLVNQASGT